MALLRPHIQQNGILRPPIYKNGQHVDPLIQKWLKFDLSHKKLTPIKNVQNLTAPDRKISPPSTKTVQNLSHYTKIPPLSTKNTIFESLIYEKGIFETTFLME